jgi:hypothetical protein
VTVLACIVLRNRQKQRHQQTASTSQPPSAPVTPLTTISIGDCEVSNTAAKHLAVALMELTPPVTLSRVSLVGNNITADGAIHLVGALISNPHIVENFVLDLTCNELSSDSGKYRQLMEYHSHLRSSKPQIEVVLPKANTTNAARRGSVVLPV